MQENSQNVSAFDRFKPFLENYEVKEVIESDYFGYTYRIETSNSVNVFSRALKVISIPTESQVQEYIRRTGNKSVEDLIKNFESVIKVTVNELNKLHQLKENFNIINYYKHFTIRQDSPIGWDIIIIMENATSIKNHIFNGKMSLLDIIKMAIDMCTTLIVCKKHGIIHGNIREDNIFYSKDGRFKLGNFFIEKNLVDQETTSMYFPPDTKSRTYYTDFYSLGITLYRLLNNGRFPFMPDYPKEIMIEDIENAMSSILAKVDIPIPSEGNKLFSEIIIKMINPNEKEKSTPETILKELQVLMQSLKPEVLYKEVNICSKKQKLEVSSKNSEDIFTLKGFSMLNFESVVKPIDKTDLINGKDEEFISIDSENTIIDLEENFRDENSKISLAKYDVNLNKSISIEQIHIEHNELPSSNNNSINQLPKSILIEEISKKKVKFKIQEKYYPAIAATVIIIFILVYIIYSGSKNEQLASNNEMNKKADVTTQLLTTTQLQTQTPEVTSMEVYDYTKFLSVEPAISKVKNSYFKVYVKDLGVNQDEIDKVAFMVWSDLDSKDDLNPSWNNTCIGTYNSNDKRWEYTDNVANHNYENGKYKVEAYIILKSTEMKKLGETEINVERANSIKIENSTESKNKFIIESAGVFIPKQKMTTVKFNIWSTKNDKDDVVVMDAKYDIKKDSWSAVGNVANHKYESGEYQIEVLGIEKGTLKPIVVNKGKINISPFTKSNSASSGIYRFVNVNSGKVLTYNPSAIEEGVLYQKDFSGVKEQLWQLNDFSGAFKLLSVSNNKCMSLTNNYNNLAKIQLKDNTSDVNQKWIFNKVGDGIFSIYSSEGKALSVSSDSINDGAQILQAGYSSKLSQQWKLEKIDSLD